MRPPGQTRAQTWLRLGKEEKSGEVFCVDVFGSVQEQ